MRGSLLALALTLLAVSAPAQDMGRKLSFRGRFSMRFAARPDAGGSPRRVLFDSGLSDEGAPAGIVLFHGVSPDPGVSFQVGRMQRGGSAAWDAELHRAADGRFWAKARLPAGSGQLFLRAVDDGVRTGGPVEIYGVELPEGDGETPEAMAVPPGVPARPPQPGAPRPFVHGRAEWNALPASEPYTPHEAVWRITLHHSDGRNTTTLAESLAEAKFIQDFHMNGRRWIDIAYHFLVDEAGNVIEGRPEDVQGAHTLSNNAGNIGICLLGKYHQAGDHRPTQAQLDAVAALARYLTLRYGIEPARFLKGHRDYKSTDCPGDNAYGNLPALRRRADGLPEELSTPIRGGRPPRQLPPLAEPPFVWDGRRFR